MNKHSKLAIASFFAAATVAMSLPVYALEGEKRIHVPINEAPESFYRQQVDQFDASKSKFTKVKLTDEHNLQYFGEFQLGSKNQTFSAIMDTGSSNIWVPGSNCVSEACQGKASFDPSSSDTYSTQHEQLTIQYGTGSMEGEVGYDSVTFGGVTVKNQGFGAAYELSNDFLNSPFDGSFGLAYRSIASDEVTPWFDNAVKQGLIPKAIFSFYLSNDPGDGTGRLIIGEPDPDYYQGDITWHSLKPIETGGVADFYYNIDFGGIGVGGNSVPLTCQSSGNGVCHAIVDSGTSLIVGPAADIQNILSYLSIASDCSNISEQPDLEFTIGDYTYSVSPEFYVIKSVLTDGSEQCMPGLSAGDEGLWIFGDAFMRSFYVVFDKTDSRVGFAALPDRLSKPKKVRRLFQWP